MKKLLKILLSRAVIFSTLILMQVISILCLIWGIGKIYTNIYILLEIISFILAIYIVNGDKNPSYKLPWLLVMLVFPLFGSFFYLFFGIRHSNTQSKKRIKNNKERCNKYLSCNVDVKEKIKNDDLLYYKHSKYLTDYSYYPPYANCYCEYFSVGELKFYKLIDEFKKAKKFIFLEYFIIKKGFMWGKILDILEEKAKEGVDVRIIYDDFGCLFSLPNNYNKILASKGIKCQIFNPLVPFINIYLNHRDHRKIAVIDGEVAFVGGTNLADEYVNVNCKLGHWKDSDIMIKGDAVWSFTVMFLQNWNIFKSYDKDWNIFKTTKCDIKQEFENNGYIQPFGDLPICSENISENTYKNLINSAKKYVYITSPYLIIDNEMQETLILAAKNGIDVRIITPKIPDKKYINLVTKAFFPKLIESGIKIYLYTPGFIHSKLVIVDDIVGVIGTANMDYRSFYLHFETGVWLYKADVLKDIKKDFLETINKSEEVSLQQLADMNIFVKIYQSILRIFSSMM